MIEFCSISALIGNGFLEAGLMSANGFSVGLLNAVFLFLTYLL